MQTILIVLNALCPDRLLQISRCCHYTRVLSLHPFLRFGDKPIGF